PSLSDPDRGEELTMPTQDKRPYEKPTLEPSSIFGAETTTCCRVNNATCSASQRMTMGKSTRASTTS
ncbi:MAG: hypothetical protein ACREK4_21035, partial [Candidatus Rokuibacteriota bacterium]